MWDFTWTSNSAATSKVYIVLPLLSCHYEWQESATHVPINVYITPLMKLLSLCWQLQLLASSIYEDITYWLESLSRLTLRKVKSDYKCIYNSYTSESITSLSVLLKYIAKWYFNCFRIAYIVTWYFSWFRIAIGILNMWEIISPLGWN